MDDTGTGDSSGPGVGIVLDEQYAVGFKVRIFNDQQPVGPRIASGGADKTLRLWPTYPDPASANS